MNEFKEAYTFQYSDGEDRSIYVSFSPGDTWPEVLEQFVGFMSNVYGYNIREQVAVAESRFGVDREMWTGPVFDPGDAL